jgi:hypothetical protein
MALATIPLEASARVCPILQFDIALQICQEEEPPLPPPERNQLAGPDGNPIPGQNRCGDNQIPVGDCPAYQNIAYMTDRCINTTEYNYARVHSIAPLCSAINPTVYVGFCYCGCLERTTEIVIEDPENSKTSSQRIDKLTAGSVQVHALTDDTTLSAVRFSPRAIEATTAGAEHHPMVVIHLAGGATLAATELHAILISTGQMVAAKDLRSGEALVKQDGSLSKIIRITREPTADDVFNLLTNAGLNHKGHMIVANGVIVGDLMWQNTLAKDLNSIEVRR